MEEANELISVAYAGQVGRINRLLDAGADINARGRNGTALHAAITAERFWCVATLIKRGADIEAMTHGLTPLALAVDAAIDRSNQCQIPQLPTDIIRLLLEAGADPKPGLKVAKDYQCEPLVTLLDGR